MASQRKTIWTAIARPLIAIGAAAVLLIGTMGCQGSDTDSGAGGIASSEIAGAETLTPAGLTPPTLTELDAVLNLSAEQQSLMQTALTNWQDAIDARRAERDAARESGEHPGRHSGFRLNGESPLQTFLVECAQFLTPDQFVAMTTLLADLRPERPERPERPQVRDSTQRPHGQMRQGGQVLNLAEELNLTDEQVSALREMFATIRQEMRPDEADKQRPTREEMQAAVDERIQEILTPEQYATWQSLRETRQAEREVEREARQVAALDNHVTFLTNLLGLDTDQALAVSTVLKDAQDQRQQLHADTQEGNLQRSELHDALQEIADAADAAIRELLTADQIKLYDAVQSLRPGPGMRGGRARVQGPF
ncbi:MAG TPA: hypothetical protein VM118_03350 [Acidobacteriota bacterium]|nr:hypothetical protein [Acidobacteriota bacterium]